MPRRTLLATNRVETTGLKRTYAHGGCRILSKQDALELNDEKVDELLNVVKECLQRLLWDSVVFTWPERGRDTSSHHKFPDNLGKRSD